MCISSPLKLLQWLVLLGAFSFLSACGGSSDSDDQISQTSQTPIQTEAIPSDSLDNATVVSGTDSNGVGVAVVVESSFAGDIAITEGLDPGLPPSYISVTKGFIEITLPPEVQGPQIVRVMSPTAFEVILALDEENTEMSYMPFHSKEDGSFEFYLLPINGSMTFALMDVPEI